MGAPLCLSENLIHVHLTRLITKWLLGGLVRFSNPLLKTLIFRLGLQAREPEQEGFWKKHILLMSIAQTIPKIQANAKDNLFLIQKIPYLPLLLWKGFLFYLKLLQNG